MDIRPYRRTVLRPLVFFGVSCFSILLIPLAARASGTASAVLGMILSGVFWGFMILGFTAVARTERELYPLRKKLRAKGLRVKQKMPGLFTLNFDRPRSLLYLGILIGLVLSISDILLDYIPETMMLLILSLTMFALAVHGVIDGRNYKTVLLFASSLEGKHEDD